MAFRNHRSGFRKRTQLLTSGSGAIAALLGGVLIAPATTFAQTNAPASTGPLELGPLRVQDQAGANALDHDTGLTTLPGTVQDTPQAIIVIPQEQLKEQGVTSLEQALRDVPGITVSIGEGGTLNGDQFKIRGFDAQNDIYIDGLRDFGVYVRDSFAYQEVQVLKGPSGTMFGRGSTGGVINTVTKTPFLGELYSADAYAGNGAYYRGLADVNKQIDGTTAIRLNLMATSNHVVDRDQIYSHRWGFDGAVAFGLGTGTKLILNYLHQDDNRIPDYGIPVAQAPGVLVMTPSSDNGVPRNTFLGYNTDRDETHADVFTERLSHRAAPWLTLTSDTRAGFYSRYFQYTTIDRCDATSATAFCSTRLFGANPQTAYGGIGGGGPYSMRAWGLQNISTARADFNLGMFRTELIAGVDASYQDNKKSFYYYSLPSTSQFTYLLGNGTASRANIGRNLFAPDHNPPPNYAPFIYNTAGVACSGTNPCTLNGLVTTATATSSGRTDGDSSDIAAFLTDRLWFTDELSVIGGVRYDRYNSEFSNFLVNGTASLLKSESNLVSPRASLVYEPDTTKTFYFTWGRASRPQGANVVGDATAIALTTKDLEPEITESYELGSKYGFLDGRFSVTASLFSEEKNNSTQVDANTGFLQAQSGEKQKVKGFELGLTGKPIPELTLSAGWSHLDSNTEESFAACAALTSTSTTGVACPVGVAVGSAVPNLAIIGRQVIFVPKDAGSFWASYDAAFAPGLTFGGGVTYQSKMPVRYNALSPVGAPALASIAEIPDTVSLDAFVAYKFGAYRVSINGYNLTDRLNYVQSFGNRGVPAPGRAVIFSVGYTY